MYDVIKGWPGEGCLDVTYPADKEKMIDKDTKLPIREGIMVTVNADGKVVPATPSDTTLQGWLLGREMLTDMCTVLLGDYVLEMDKDHYDDTATFTPGAKVGAMSDGSGKIAAGGSGVAFGRVLSVNATTGKIVIVAGCC